MLNHQMKKEVHVHFEKRFHTVFVYTLYSLDKKCKHNEAKIKQKIKKGKTLQLILIKMPFSKKIFTENTELSKACNLFFSGYSSVSKLAGI
jgi:hypothetical protein